MIWNQGQLAVISKPHLIKRRCFIQTLICGCRGITFFKEQPLSKIWNGWYNSLTKAIYFVYAAWHRENWKIESIYHMHHKNTCIWRKNSNKLKVKWKWLKNKSSMILTLSNILMSWKRLDHMHVNELLRQMTSIQQCQISSSLTTEKIKDESLYI